MVRLLAIVADFAGPGAFLGYYLTEHPSLVLIYRFVVGHGGNAVTEFSRDGGDVRDKQPAYEPQVGIIDMLKKKHGRDSVESAANKVFFHQWFQMSWVGVMS